MSARQKICAVNIIHKPLYETSARSVRQQHLTDSGIVITGCSFTVLLLGVETRDC